MSTSVETHTALEVDGEGAVEWAARHPGWYIFPGAMVADDDGRWIKRPLVRWTEKASTDPDAIRKMWTEAGGRAVVCVACHPSGIWVLDEDSDPGDEWTALLKGIRDGHRTLVLASCTKARPHYIFTQDPSDFVAEGKWEGGDVKATGIIFVSTHDPIVDAPVAPAPKALTDRLKKGRPKGSGHGIATTEDLWNWLANTPDDFLFPRAVQDKFLDVMIAKMADSVDAGEHRRQVALNTVFHAAIESTCGCYSAEDAYLAIKDEYRRMREVDSGSKGWTKARQDDYELMWATLVPALEAGAYDDEVAETHRRVSGYHATLDDVEDEEDNRRLIEQILLKSTKVPVSTAPLDVPVEDPPDPDVPSKESTPDDDWAPIVSVSSPLPEGKPPTSPSPTLSEDALWGPHGELVEALRGRTESADIGILGALLAYSGACNAGKAHFKVGVDQHGPNVYVLNIGASSAARKSSALSLVRHIFYSRADDVPVSFLPRRVSGIASGERLIHVWTPTHDDDSDTDVWPERRVILEESEASAVWKRARRDGAVLPDVYCRMWDQTDLSNHAITSGSVMVPADRHLAGFIGASTVHVAVEAVTAGDGSDAKSGFGNRFLWLYLPDSGVDLPFGGDLPTGAIRRYQDTLGLYDGSLGRIGETGFGREVVFEPEAAELWQDMYSIIKRDKGTPGLIEGMCSRGESQVLRLSLNYWLAARGSLTTGVGIDALRAAMAVWRYAKSSVEYIFGDTTGDKDLDNLRADLASRGGWASLEELRVDLNRNIIAAVIDRGVKVGLLTSGRVNTGKRGRPPRAICITDWLRDGRLVHESHGGRHTRGIALSDVSWD